MKRDVVTLVVWLVAIYAAICGAAYFGNRVFMYFPDPTRVAPMEVGLNGVKEIEIAVAEGVTLIAWHAPAKDDKPTMLYFHGNAANAANRAARIETINENGVCVLYLNNRGYGGSGGRPTEEDNVADAIVAYDYLIGLGCRHARSSPTASRWVPVRRCGWRRQGPSPRWCWKPRLPRPSMWRGGPIFGCRSVC
jgi:hypothetical protein